MSAPPSTNQMPGPPSSQQQMQLQQQQYQRQAQPQRQQQWGYPQSAPPAVYANTPAMHANGHPAAPPHKGGVLSSLHLPFGHKEEHFADPHWEQHVELKYSLGPPRHPVPRIQALSFEGVRVLECSKRTWTAALCGQMLATNGADVVRVHIPIKTPDGKEATPVVPDFFHVSKRLAPLRVEVPEDLAMIQRDVLPATDIFLTDLPVDELQSLGLDFPRMSAALPHIVYVIVSAIGPRADIEFKGVEDAGAFFSLSGLAEEVGKRLGPIGFAAGTSASALFGGLCIAMLRRRSGAKGNRVEMSLARAGKWCATLGVLTNFVSPPAEDGGVLAAPEAVKRPPVLPFQVEGAAHIPPPPHPRVAGEFLYRWREPSNKTPPPQMHSPLAEESPLSRISVLEVSDEYLISASALGRLLMDMGASVTKVERPQRPDPWKKNAPPLYEALNRGKTVEHWNYGHIWGESAMYKALAEASVFITNLPAHALEHWGFGLPMLRQMFPHLVIVLITTWGNDREGVMRDFAEQENLAGHETHAFWEASGLSNHAFFDRPMPPGLSELAVAHHALAGLGMALMRQQVTQEGQFVHVGRYQAGLFCRMLCEVVQVHPCQSQLLETKDGRFIRLLGRGHNPHEVWMLLHAVGKREGVLEKAQGVLKLPINAMQGHSWDSVEKHHQELVRAARQWRFDELAQAFRERRIDWFVEELRPRQAAMLHQRRVEAAEAQGGSDMHRQLSKKHEQQQQRVQEIEGNLEERRRERDRRRGGGGGQRPHSRANRRGHDVRPDSFGSAPGSPRSPRSPMSPTTARNEQEYKRLLQEYEEAQELMEKTGLQAKELHSVLDLADNAGKWLRDAEKNALTPWSIEHKAWKEAVGGHSLLIPACWLK